MIQSPQVTAGLPDAQIWHICRKNIIQKDTYISVFIAALFIIAKTWKQPKCPSTDEWRKKTWYIQTMKYYSAIKKE